MITSWFIQGIFFSEMLTFSGNVNSVFQEVLPVVSPSVACRVLLQVLLEVASVWYLSSLMVIQKHSAACFLGFFLLNWELVWLTKRVKYRMFRFVICTDSAIPYRASWSAGQGIWRLNYIVMSWEMSIGTRVRGHGIPWIKYAANKCGLSSLASSCIAFISPCCLS